MPGDCLAPPGFYYLRGRAVACAKGTYKETTNNTDCEVCPTGFTTMDGLPTPAVSRAECSCEFAGADGKVPSVWVASRLLSSCLLCHIIKLPPSPAPSH
jgi:hypothetical protein